MLRGLRWQAHQTVLALFFLATTAEAYNNGMARKPPMGWNSWCTDSLCNLRGKDPCSEHMVKTTADRMVAQGMPSLGYNYVTLDDCWSATTRDGNGELQADAKAFPNGMKAVADYVHSKGMFFGLYTCAGTLTCKGGRPGSYGHYEQDAKTLASWGIDEIKMDHCHMPHNVTDKEAYGQMSQALNATGRPITFSLCQWGLDSVWEWGHEIAQMFRVQMDHLPFFNLPTHSAGAGIGQGTLQIIEWMAELKPSQWVRPYGWLDPDFLMTLYPLTMDFVVSRTEYTFWSLWSAPLLVATDIRYMSHEMRSILLNPEVIAINQDVSGTGGDRLRKDNASGAQLWARPLANGDKAVALFNDGAGRGGRAPMDSAPSALNISCSWGELGWPTDARVRVRDLWARRDLGIFDGGYTGERIGARDVRFLRLSKL